ncbi:U4/U6 small nuclear ribonucleoprotein Prp3-like, partial [Trifolium medium]|nr:U4/U6 small nuclear ribonucleoprotein Prp3-like [Trifolium medium]
CAGLNFGPSSFLSYQDGSSSTAGKHGSLSVAALAKAKKALQMQKELSQKLKRIPQ